MAFGGMAEVFRARKRGESGFSKVVAIKRVLPQFAEDRDFVSMFVDEAVLAAKLNHPNVVTIYDFGQITGSFYIAMEYVEGIDLRKLQQAAADRHQALGELRALVIALGIARGLAHAHDRVHEGVALSIVHRDVSPHNVLVSVAGEVKVMDFGIARAAQRSTRTSTGVVKGKLAYMAPEQARGDDVDARADIFAAGLVIWEMLAGERAFNADNEMRLLIKVQKGEVQPIAKKARVNAQLAAIVDRMLATDLDKRYQHMREVEADLSKVLHKLGGEQAAGLGAFVNQFVVAESTDDQLIAAPATTMLPPKPKSPPWLLLGIGGLLSAGLGSLIVYLSSAPAQQPAPPIVAAAPQEPATPLPAATQPTAAPAVVEAEAPAKKSMPRGKDKRVEPGPSAFVSIASCPRGSVILDNGREWLKLAGGAQRNARVAPGTHVFSLREMNGSVRTLKKMTLRQDETELIDCGD